MSRKSIFAFVCTVFFALTLCGCNRQPRNINLGNASAVKPDELALIREGTMVLRGLDYKVLTMDEKQNPFSDAYYAIPSGVHSLLTMEIQKGHIVPYSDMRCYIISADLKAGVRYRIDYDANRKLSVLKREDNGVVVASGELSSKKAAFSNPCDWTQTSAAQQQKDGKK